MGTEMTAISNWEMDFYLNREKRRSDHGFSTAAHEAVPQAFADRPSHADTTRAERTPHSATDQFPLPLRPWSAPAQTSPSRSLRRRRSSGNTPHAKGGLQTSIRPH